MPLIVDDLFHIVDSETTSGKKYEVRLRGDGTHWWLSCQCLKWCKGKHNTGKEVWQRRCNHTDSTIIEQGKKLEARGIKLQRGNEQIEVRNVLGTPIPEIMELGTGANRRVLR